MELLFSRARDESGEVLDRVTMDEWRRAAALIGGLELTDFIPGRNPFTGDAVRIPSPGAGVWRFGEAHHVVRFECGVVTIPDATVEMRSALIAAATSLGAAVTEHEVPAFAADRLTLAQLMRRSLMSLPSDAEAFSSSLAFAPDMPCLLLEVSAAVPSPSALAAELGYPEALLPNEILEQVGEAARLFMDPPSDDLLIESFDYYRRFDAFLPKPGAPEPPPWEETQARLDREFVALLGPERASPACRHEQCDRGAVPLSALCKRHHFESIQGRPYPFDD